jgi:1,4-alpha-glucan branching enzyme
MSLAPSPAIIDSVIQARCADIFAVLGPHRLADDPGRARLTVFRPDADKVAVIGPDGAERAVLDRIDPAGLFSADLPAVVLEGYRLRLHRLESVWEIDDPYRFPPVLGEMDRYLMGEGRHWRLYDRLGAHPDQVEGVAGVRFAVWAPNAQRASVVGDFNNWDGRIHMMRKHPGIGVWEIFIPGVAAGAAYKYEFLSADGALLPLKADPFAQAAEFRPSTASLVPTPLPDQWQDQDWLARRKERNARSAPMSIYEVHLGSWKRGADGTFPTYRELAETLVPYVKEMGFTHIEVMPVHEHPFDGSWGYQALGLYAPTARFGSPADFQLFVDACHQAGIGLIIDWVPGHFPTDAHGLYQFDGTHLYDHADPRQGYHPDWNTAIYNFGRNEVTNFLIANALFWLRRYHVDGLRVDAVASMLYLDYSRNEGEWIPNRYGGRENLEAIDFMRRMNELVYGEDEGQGGGAITIAEESTAWPGVSRPAYVGGLGFGYKWNMGWMHDTLRYMARDPIHRRFHHNDLTFGLLYAFSENFILPLSHDEVVHGKGSLLGRMPGDDWQKFANLRAYFAFMWTHPGKKLLFMGGEFGQRREWNHDAELDWFLLDDAGTGHWHRGLRDLVRDLNHLYRDTPALHERDCEPEGFRWIKGAASDESILVYSRHGAAPDRAAVTVASFTPLVREKYRIGLPFPGHWREALNSDAECYGGSNIGNGGGVVAESVPWDGQPYSAEITVPPLATLVLVRG